jgi:bacillithiol synthase
MQEILPTATNSDFMFSVTPLEFAKSIGMNALVGDYIRGEEKLKPFFSHEPSLAGFRNAIKNDPYKDLDRERLVSILRRQALLVKNTSKKSLANVDMLGEKNTYAITTGHQLCLFTGPVYFVYKLLSAIKLAEDLNKEFNDKHFVPVYWLAGEDHDFAEVNHFHVFGKKIEWKTEQLGPVGRFKTTGLKDVYDQFASVAGDTKEAKAMLELFSNAYLSHDTLNDATRYLVNALFGKYGVVIADGNDREFKSQFGTEFKRDMLDQHAAKKLSESVAALEKMGYEAQVKPRDVNAFYMEEGLRTRIDRSNGEFQLQNGKRMSHAELSALIAESPEKLSPNVTLRPLYQQKILPNIAYVGGPGELAYWLEYKDMFEAFGISFPVLVLRDSFTLVDRSTIDKLAKLGLTIDEVFGNEDDQIRRIQQRKGDTFLADDELDALRKLYQSLIEKAAATDPTLRASAAAELQKAEKGIETIVQKANRSLKSRLDTEISQLRNIRSKILPEKLPQERHENFSSFYLRYGEGWFDELLEKCSVFDSVHKVLIG